MKIKEGFVLRQIGDSYMAVPIGREANHLKGVIALNATAARIWRELEQDNTPKAIAEKLTGEYNATYEELLCYIGEFLDLLRQKELLE